MDRNWPRPRAEGFEVIWSNQWAPDEVTRTGDGKQWASRVYTERFGSDGHQGGDIHEFTKTKLDIYSIPEHDLLVGGFPCQDYSVARTVSGELGILGEKGRLWKPIWQIIKWIHKNETQERPKIILLENVPRLLNSPAEARGLNFSIILKRLLGLGYEVEWRVIDASDYGMPQQRKRVFILAYRTPGSGGGTRKINGLVSYGLCGRNRKMKNPMEHWMFGNPAIIHNRGWEVSPFARAFPAEFNSYKRRALSLENLSSMSSDFGNAGYAWTGSKDGKRSIKQFCSWKTSALYEGEHITLGNVLEKNENVKTEYVVNKSRLYEWNYVKGPRKEWRIRKRDRGMVGDKLWKTYQECLASMNQKKWDKHESEFANLEGENGPYRYVEGAITYPDSLDRASRTVVTAEIGNSPSRMRHIIERDGVRRRLMPIEIERLNQFPDNWTKIEGISDSKRGFLMGNALVVGVIGRLREPLRDHITTRLANSSL